MALPATRINFLTNPVPASTTGFASSGGAGTWAFINSNVVDDWNRFTKDATTATTALYWGSAITAPVGTTFSFRFWLRASVSATVTLRNNGTAFTGTGSTVTLAANVWTEVVFNGHVTTVADFRPAILMTNMPANSTWDFKRGIVEKASTVGEYFDGSYTDPNYTHAWTGTANASTSTKEYYGIWVEQIAGPGAPRVQVTAIGLGSTAVTTQVTREAGREVWTVPGWKARNTLGGDTAPDIAPPLGIPVKYSLFAAGQPINNMTITVNSTTGWIQDPLNHETALPVATTGDDPSTLALAKPALKKMVYAARYEEEYPLGGRYPVVRASARGGAEGVEVFLNAQTNAASDALLALVEQSPILLFRGLPSWGSLPPLAYTIGNAEEAPLNRDVGGGFTQWLTGGKLVAPVSTGPKKGLITHQMVQDNLVGRTHASIEASSGNKRHIEIQANPLGLGQ